MIGYRHAWLQWVCVAAVFGLNGGWTYVAAAPATTAVYPTGSFPLDVQNVQAAVDRGGTVVLKATNAAGQPTVFNFGPPDLAVVNVFLTSNVSILGEQVGEYATTINGGSFPIVGLLPVKATIQGIHFEAPLGAAITLVSSAGAEIIGNRINGVIGFPTRFGFTSGDGIDVSGFDDPQNAITGRIKVADNVIENLGANFANGIQFDSVAAEVEVSGNTVRFAQSNGFIQQWGIFAWRSHNRVAIVGNQVTIGPGYFDVFPSGIVVGGGADARYLVSGNTVIVNHPNADGIDVVGVGSSGPTQGAVIEGNHVVISSSLLTSGGISVDGAVRNSLVSANRIEGTAGNALQVLGFNSSLTADSNHALGNDISQLSALNGDVLFGTYSSNNLFAGHCNTYVDLGVDNRILCGTAIGSVAGAAQIPSRSYVIDVLGTDIQRAKLDAMRNRPVR
jgi:hypothetical protein